MKLNPEQQDNVSWYLRKVNYTEELVDHILISGIL